MEDEWSTLAVLCLLWIGFILGWITGFVYGYDLNLNDNLNNWRSTISRRRDAEAEPREDVTG